MSDFTNTREQRAGLRWQLLATVSAIALLGSAYGAGKARAADSDRPLFWIELDGQFAQQKNDQEIFVPSFMLASPFDGAAHAGMEKGPPTIWDKGAKITLQPDGSDWLFSASVRYGNNRRSEARHQLTAHPTVGYFGVNYRAYQDFSASSSEGHTIIDFQAGKDFGLGMFGNSGSSAIDLGVRYAQFNSQSHVGIQSQPTNVATFVGTFHRFYGTFAATRKFSGVGPSLSWDASASLAGNPSAGRITFDWGLNGAVLFGRQRAQIHHQTSNTIHMPRTGTYPNTNSDAHYRVSQHAASPNRSKQVIVPNAGGFAAVSWRSSNAKISIGYRADYFFGAIDGGIDTAKKEDRGFYGPFASVSLGLGD